MARTKATAKLIRSKIVYDPATKTVRIGLGIEAKVGPVSDDSDMAWIVDLESAGHSDVGGLWPVKVKTKLIVKMYAKLEGGDLNKLRRELAIAALRKNKEVVV